MNVVVHKRLRIGSEFAPIFRKFCVPLHCQASQMEISKRNSTKLRQTVDGRPRKQSAVKKLGSYLPKIGGQKSLHLFGFSTTSGINGGFLLNETWHRQPGQGIGTHEGSPTSSQNFMNFVPQTAWSRTEVFTHRYYFVLSQSIAHPLSGINVEPHSDSKLNGIGFVCSSELRPQMLSRRTALSGNTSL